MIVPRCLFFVEEAVNPAVIQAGQTITVNPRRGAYDREPWRSLDLAAITDLTIEHRHVFDVYLGETVVPYAVRNPLKAVLPLKKGATGLPIDADEPGGISPGGLEWRRDSGDRPLRVVYTGISGIPTAALVSDNEAVIDHALYWITCKGKEEANYLMAIINSDRLSKAVTPLMPKGQFGARDLHKHLWKLPIPEFDAGNPQHVQVSQAGEAAAKGEAKQLAQLRQDRGEVSVTIARRELRKWLRESAEGKAVEKAVEKLLRTEQMPTNSPSGSD